MALRVAESDLPDLLSWIQQYLPESFEVHREVKFHLRDQFPDQAFYVDRWPHPQAVVCVMDPAGTKLDYRKDTIHGVFGVTDHVLTTMLRDRKVVDWTKPMLICGVCNTLWPVIKSVANEMNGSVSDCPTFLLRATPQDLKAVPVPETMKISPLSEDDVSIVDSTWRYQGSATGSFIRELIQKFPSVKLTTLHDEHVGHMVGSSFRTMGMLYIFPRFRRNGYAKVIVSHLARKFFESGEDAYVNIKEDNEASLNLHLSLGFQIVRDLQLGFFCYRPHPVI